MAPQIAVAMNMSADNRIAERRPKTSASRPQTIEPTVVPVSATNGIQPAVAWSMPYSRPMPGNTKPSVAGFITSMASATTSTTTRVQCARFSGTPSATCSQPTLSAAIDDRGSLAWRGIKLQPASARPIGITAMPAHMPVLIGMPTICQCV